MSLLLLSLIALFPAHAEPPSPSEYVARFQSALQKHAGARLPDKFMARVVFHVKPLWHNGDDAGCLTERPMKPLWVDDPRGCTDKIVIELDSWTWIHANDLYREILVFHELGHCVLSRGHEEEKWDGIPASLMVQSGLGWKTYLVRREGYHAELLKRYSVHAVELPLFADLPVLDQEPAARFRILRINALIEDEAAFFLAHRKVWVFKRPHLFNLSRLSVDLSGIRILKHANTAPSDVRLVHEFAWRRWGLLWPFFPAGVQCEEERQGRQYEYGKSELASR